MRYATRLILVFAFLLAMLPAGLMAAETITLTTDDDVEATKSMIDWVKENGYTVADEGETWFKVEGSILTLILMPKLTDGGLDRVVVRFYFIVDKDYSANHYSELVQHIMTLNGTYNVGIWSLDEDKDIVFEGYMTFVDKLEIKEFKAYLNWYESAIQEVFGSNSDLMQILAD